MAEFAQAYYVFLALSAISAATVVFVKVSEFFERLKALRHYHSGGCVIVNDGPFFPMVMRGPRSPFADDRMTLRWREPEDYRHVLIATKEEIERAEMREEESRKRGVEMTFVG